MSSSLPSPSSQQHRQLGVTPPVSTTLPTARDLELSTALEDRLVALELYPSASDATLREEVLASLSQEVRSWAKTVALTQNVPDALAQEIGDSARLYTFGSYRLGVNAPNADVDTLCVVPQLVSREDFFSTFYARLQARSDVAELAAVPDAYVPVIKLNLRGIELDILFARLAQPLIARDLDVLSDTVLAGMDDKSVRSLNGVRVADAVLRLVPNPAHFRTALRTVKYWATRRGIYGNALGFLGGVSWALLVARVCQLYPNALPAALVAKFFRVYTQWKWPAPVLLCAVEHGGGLGTQVWNPRANPRDRAHLLPIITPAYPAMNSTHNVSASTKRLLLSEMQRAAETVLKVEQGLTRWDSLFERTQLFTLYKYYVRVDCLARTKAEHTKWQGYVESRVRFMLLRLEQTPGVAFAHPHTKTFTYLHPQYAHCAVFFLGLSLSSQVSGTASSTVDLTPAVIEFRQQVDAWPEKSSGMALDVNWVKQSQLPQFIFEQGEPRLPPSSANGGKRKARPAQATGNTSIAPAALKTSAPIVSEPLGEPPTKRQRVSESQDVASGHAMDPLPSPSSTTDNMKVVVSEVQELL